MRGSGSRDAGIGIVHAVRRIVESAARRDNGSNRWSGFLVAGSVHGVFQLEGDSPLERISEVGHAAGIAWLELQTRLLILVGILHRD
jgi:hypothetical protein